MKGLEIKTILIQYQYQVTAILLPCFSLDVLFVCFGIPYLEEHNRSNLREAKITAVKDSWEGTGDQ